MTYVSFGLLHESDLVFSLMIKLRLADAGQPNTYMQDNQDLQKLIFSLPRKVYKSPSHEELTRCRRHEKKLDEMLV